MGDLNHVIETINEVYFNWDKLDDGYKQVVTQSSENIRKSKNLEEAKNIAPTSNEFSQNRKLTLPSTSKVTSKKSSSRF